MAIVMRRGKYNDFDASKMLPGEIAVVLSGDSSAVDGRTFYICFEPGKVKRLMTFEDLKREIDSVTADIVEQVTVVADKAENAGDRLDAADDILDLLTQKTTAANTAKTQLESATGTANTARANLVTVTTAANTAKGQLDTSTTAANTARTNLVNTTTAADTAKNNLTTATTAANTAKGQLDTATSTANTARTNLANVTTTANTVKTDLNTAVSKANEAIGNLNPIQEQIDGIKNTKVNGKILSSDITLNGSDIHAGIQGETLTVAQYLQSLADNKLEKASLLNLVYPVGAIYISITSTNPSTIIGGTWVAFAQGQTLVGVNPSDADFNMAQKTGGSKTISLTDTQVGAKKSGVEATGYGLGSAAAFANRVLVGYSHSNPREEINQLQPYITVYMWRRTA
ncbi:phage baseplate protein [Scatolibacter rhodanostii]|uniref:phage baseplate protein n=1 Tax=Scatolibacter rhodanostii TaxID=2014781 RepID=UPI000C08377C|nr:hypothetical protein [Scatolibacter rhodanostii]